MSCHRSFPNAERESLRNKFIQIDRWNSCLIFFRYFIKLLTLRSLSLAFMLHAYWIISFGAVLLASVCLCFHSMPYVGLPSTEAAYVGNIDAIITLDYWLWGDVDCDPRQIFVLSRFRSRRNFFYQKFANKAFCYSFGFFFSSPASFANCFKQK